MTNATKAILCVGNDMMGDDGAGVLVANMLNERNSDWQVYVGGSFPEGESAAIRQCAPKTLVIVDATEMGLQPGAIRQIDPDMIGEMMLMSTHSMPLNFLIDDLKEAVGEVVMIGIQPDIVGFCYPMTEAVKDASVQLAQLLNDAKELWRQLPPLIDEMADESCL
ncbi:hydrogenase maturation peptidase HycI [Celerinatantimonas sp. MCCC 1A17872]|uniref:hydrogenase maturation peptidase HycI n=1 Tax=Celerinatantimonas sp. MCCC 1A17872 TaxID=3177514 RepID=UPI0038C1E82A